jgi:hypothetical protein
MQKLAKAQVGEISSQRIEMRLRERLPGEAEDKN